MPPAYPHGRLRAPGPWEERRELRMVSWEAGSHLGAPAAFLCSGVTEASVGGEGGGGVCLKCKLSESHLPKF